jgi:hypothetical protein
MIPSQCPIGFSDCNSNGIPDDVDVVEFGAPDCNVNDVPDECDVAFGTSADCNTNAIPDVCDAGFVIGIPVPAGDPIPDADTNGMIGEVVDAVSVSGAGTLTIADLDVRVNIAHSWDADLFLWVFHEGLWINLCGGVGGGGDDFAGTVFDDEASLPITLGTPPFAGTFAPIPGPLSAFDGMPVNGTWAFAVQDGGIGDTGTLLSWTLFVSVGGASPDANDNGIPDECEGPTDCNSNGIPDELEPDCNNNGVPDDCDIADGTLDDCNRNGAPDPCESFPDCNMNGVPDECDIVGETSEDCDCDGVPDECQRDCNTNGTPDFKDIDDGVAGDFDGDVIPDACDTDPVVYNPDQSQAGSSGTVAEVSIAQVDFISSDGTPRLLNSDYGNIRVMSPHLGHAQAFLNVEINGAHTIVNMPVVARDFAVDSPMEAHASMFAIGPRGVDQTGATALVRLTVTAQRKNFVEPIAPLVSTVVGAMIEQVGFNREDGGPDPDDTHDTLPAPADDAGQHDAPAPGSEEKMSVSRPNFNMVDLEGRDEYNACAPGAIGSSFVWLNRTYCLGQPEEPDPDDTKQDALERMKEYVRYNPDLGTLWGKIYPGVRACVTLHELPITIEGAGLGSPHPGAPLDPCDIFKQLELGQDVEIHIAWVHIVVDPTDPDMEAHVEFVGIAHTQAVVAMTKQGDVITVTTHDDANQCDADPDPNAEDRPSRNIQTGRLRMIDGHWVIDGESADAVLVGWISESPTLAAINRAICDKAQELANDINALPGPPTMDELCDYLRRACHLKYLAERAFNKIECMDPPATSLQRGTVRELRDVACELKNAAKGAKYLAQQGQPFLAKLAMTANLASALKSVSMAFKDAFPPDGDFDDIPDADDNAPMVANPDQADCNTNGIGDILELDDNDCNENGVPDECDPDCNTNGVPDECDIAGLTSYDWDFNCVPDDCQIAAGTADDCNTNQFLDDCDVAFGSSADCNTNHIPDECEVPPDCNTNGVPDVCDPDCNTNGIPDDCEQPIDDCNTNGVPDECDVPDCNTNGVPDECDVPPDCNTNDVPDECETPDCNSNGVPDECDVPPDCNTNDVPDECDMPDCNTNGLPDECDVPPDCNTNGIPDACDIPDCNTNGAPDACEGIPDCNSNGVPDVCELMPDCNTNGVPDVCDLPPDCNTNAIPDACEGPDCDTNGSPDVCDLTPDCNTNAIPDACEGPDCNANGVPDFCESTDPDGDLVYTICDNCPTNFNPGQADFDGDGLGDVCDPCPIDHPNDTDMDGVCDSADVCPGFDDNIDADNDGVPDGCDVCPGFPDGVDTDMDGIPDGCDCACPGDMNSDSFRDGDDIQAFVTTLLAGPYDPCADLNSDGMVNAVDASLLVSVLLTGPPCP